MKLPITGKFMREKNVIIGRKVRGAGRRPQEKWY